MKVRVANVVVATVIMASAVSAAVADETRAKLRQDCRNDYQQYCTGVQPGGGRVKQCLIDHRDHLTEKCRTTLDEAIAAQNAAAPAQTRN